MSTARLAALALVTLLAACATQAPPPADTTGVPGTAPPATEGELWAAHKARLEPLDHWTLRGKVAYRLPEQAGSANLSWRQAAEESELRLAGPLGAGAVQIATEGPLLKLRRDGIERLYPADAAPWLGDGRLLPIPINALPYWLRGLPDPESDVDALETQDGLARSLSQHGWTMAYDAYDMHGENGGLALPERITIVASESELTLKLLLRGWAIMETDAASP